VFRDYKVKLGDFGISIKLPDVYEPGDTIKLLGLTRDYCMPEIVKAFNQNEAVTYEQLFNNDRYALYQTFLKIKHQF
jgi:hypothetical protein